MHKIIDNLRSSSRIKQILYFCIIFFLFAYCFSIPSFGSRERLNLIMYAFMALLAVSLLLYLFLYDKLTFSRSTLPIPFFVLFSLIGTIIYSHQYRSWLTLLLLALSFYILYYCFNIIKNKNKVLIILTTALFIFSCYFIFVNRSALLDFKNYENLRLGYPFDNPNGVSAFSVITFLMSLYLLLFLKKKYRWLFIFSIIASLIIGVSTGSRTFIVAIIIITLIVTFIKFKRHLIIYFSIVGLLAVIFVIVFSLPVMATLRDRFIRIFWTFFTDSSRVDTSSLQRLTWLDYGFYLGNKNIFTGIGVYGFSTLSGVGTYTHSNFSEVWCDFGLPGFILFYLPLCYCLYGSIKNRNRNISLIIPIFVYYFLVSFSNVFYYNKFYYFNLALVYYLTLNEKEDVNIKAINNLGDYLKHIVITCDGMQSGGAEKVIASLSNELVDKGFQVTIIGVSTNDTESFYKLNDRVKYITLHNGDDKKIKPFKRVRLLRKTIKSLKPDVIISFLPHVNVYTYYATLCMKVPVIVSERNNPKVDPKGFILRRLKKIAFYQADGAVFQTKESTYYYRKSIRDKGTMIYNPVEQRLLDIKASKKKNKVILSVGRLTEQKNFKCLIDAFAIFSNNHPGYILRIYGEGHLHDELLEYASSKGIGDKFELLSPDSNWQEKEKDDAMFILSSDYEGMPNALLEAMVIGIPCISTDCPSGGPLELIKDGENGYLTKVGDVTEMANKMELLLEKPLIFDIEDSSRSFNQTKICDDWLEYIKVVMERKLST